MRPEASAWLGGGLACGALVVKLLAGGGPVALGALAVLVAAGVLAWREELRLRQAQLSDAETQAKADTALARVGELSGQVEQLQRQLQQLQNRPQPQPAPVPTRTAFPRLP